MVVITEVFGFGVVEEDWVALLVGLRVVVGSGPVDVVGKSVGEPDVAAVVVRGWVVIGLTGTGIKPLSWPRQSPHTNSKTHSCEVTAADILFS